MVTKFSMYFRKNRYQTRRIFKVNQWYQKSCRTQFCSSSIRGCGVQACVSTHSKGSLVDPLSWYYNQLVGTWKCKQCHHAREKPNGVELERLLNLVWSQGIRWSSDSCSVPVFFWQSLKKIKKNIVWAKKKGWPKKCLRYFWENLKKMFENHKENRFRHAE